MPSTIDCLEHPFEQIPILDHPEQSTSPPGPLARATHALAELERLAELLAVEDGYDPAVRDFVIPRNFKLSVVIPVYNEEATIRHVLSHVAALPIPKEIIVVDDASSDGTRKILTELECAAGVHVIFKPKNEGKGAALRTGFRRVTGDVVIVQDADLEYDPRDILPVIKPIVCGLADVVYGSRFLDHPLTPLATRVPPGNALPRGSSLAGAADTSVGPGSPDPAPHATTWLHRTGNRWLTALSNWTTGLEITDMETCYKAFRREVLQSFEIEQRRFGFEPEITARIARKKLRLYEVPIRYTPRGYSDGKKIGLRDLLTALYCIPRYAWFD